MHVGLMLIQDLSHPALGYREVRHTCQVELGMDNSFVRSVHEPQDIREQVG